MVRNVAGASARRSARGARLASPSGSRRLQAGGLDGQPRLQIGQSRLSAFVVIEPVRAKAVMTPASSEVVHRQARAVATQEPLEGAERLSAVLALARGNRRLGQRLDQRGRVQRLLVTLGNPTQRRLAGSTPPVADQ